MILRSLKINRLHEALTLDISFNEDITLLVGINGSGKTSVLNVIDWLLKPDLKRLAIAEYNSLSLKFSHEGKDYEISSTKSKAQVVFSIISNGEGVVPITIDIKHVDGDEDRMSEYYGNLTLEKHEMPMWELLKSFSKPTIISLDRTISAESEEVQYIETPRGLTPRRIRNQSPLGYVREVTSAKYAEYRTKAISNDEELKAEIVMSALQPPELSVKGRAMKVMTKTELAHLENKVTSYLSGTIKSTDFAKQVKSFFSSSRLLAQELPREKEKNFLLNFVNSQYRQIENLAKAFNDYEKKNASSFAILNEYLSAINRFFSDSNKELFFDESTGKLVFAFIDQSQQRSAKRAITYLSSGERQILILFTFLTFSSQTQGVFIVDEPELSLHPKWQHEFMEVFLKLRPSDTQLLLATHSPDIVGKYKKSCITLRSAQ